MRLSKAKIQLQEAIANNICNLIAKEGISVKKIAEECNVTPMYMHYVTQGTRMPSADVVYSLSKHFGVTMESICKMSE